MARIDTITLPDGTTFRPSDWTTAEPLYSTVEVGPGTFSRLVAFSYGRGGEIPGSPIQRASTYADTNLRGEGNKLPEDEDIVIFNIANDVFKDGAAEDTNIFPDPENPEVPLPDMLRLQRDLLQVLWIADVKEYTHSPLSYWPAGQGVDYTTSGGLSRAAGGVSGTVRASNGGVCPGDARELASPLYIAGGETFRVEYQPGPGQILNLNLAANSRLRIRVSLDGYRKRPVA